MASLPYFLTALFPVFLFCAFILPAMYQSRRNPDGPTNGPRIDELIKHQDVVGYWQFRLSNYVISGILGLLLTVTHGVRVILEFQKSETPYSPSLYDQFEIAFLALFFAGCLFFLFQAAHHLKIGWPKARDTRLGRKIANEFQKLSAADKANDQAKFGPNGAITKQ